MKPLIYFIILAFVLSPTAGCKTKTVYVPVEKVRTEIEIMDRWNKDSVYIHDSILIVHKGDTIYLEKYKYIYKDRLVRDSVRIVDSIMVQKPYPVIEVREVNQLKSWQVIMMCLGAACIGWLVFRTIRLFK